MQDIYITGQSIVLFFCRTGEKICRLTRADIRLAFDITKIIVNDVFQKEYYFQKRTILTKHYCSSV